MVNFFQLHATPSSETAWASINAKVIPIINLSTNPLPNTPLEVMLEQVGMASQWINRVLTVITEGRFKNSRLSIKTLEFLSSQLTKGSRTKSIMHDIEAVLFERKTTYSKIQQRLTLRHATIQSQHEQPSSQHCSESNPLSSTSGSPNSRKTRKTISSMSTK